MVRVALVLQPTFVAAPKQKMLVGLGNRSAKTPAGIIVGLRALRSAVVVVVPVVGIENTVAGVEIRLAVVVGAARLADAAHYDRSERRICTEVRALHSNSPREL